MALIEARDLEKQAEVSLVLDTGGIASKANL
jgi:hypothetical protein